MDAKNYKWWDLPSSIILLFALFVAATRLQVTNWTDTLYITVNLVLMGGILGILLGASRFKPRTVTLFSLVYTIFFVVWQTSQTIESYINWQDRLQNLWLRIVFSIYQITRSLPADDAILFLLLVGLFCWLLGLTAGYYLVRKGQPMIPVIIMAVGMIVIEFFEPGNKHPIISSFFFILALLLLARINYLHSQEEWRKQGVQVDMELGFDISRGAVAAGVILVLLAWNTPEIIKIIKPGSLERKQFEQSLNDFEQTFNNFVAPLKNVEPRPFVYDDRLELGTGADLGDRLLYTIQSSLPDNAGVRYYWRVRIYDVYRDGAWRNANFSRRRIPSFEQLLDYPDYIGRTKANFTIQLRSSLEDQLIIPTAPLAISRNVTAQYLQNGLEEADIVLLTPDEEIGSGKIYLVQSLIPMPTIPELKAAGSNYPQWVQ
ncbi:MAG: hypothetical protein HGA86_07225, partial [Anaerolineaceae bacterium]|nr:hypothetical protein [Anaerolineaceae bacterium]